MLGLEVAVANLAVPITTTPEKFMWIIQNLHETHILTAILSSVALSILIGCKLFKARLVKRKYLRLLAYLPEVLVVVMLATFFSYIFQWDNDGLQVLGEISVGATKIKSPIGKSALPYLQQCLGTSVRLVRFTSFILLLGR